MITGIGIEKILKRRKVMKLKTLINQIGRMAINQKLVNYSASAGSIAQINPVKVDYYPLLFITPSGEHIIRENTTTYTINLTYVDRLLQDNSNDIDIYSNSIAELKNIINGIKEIEGVIDVEDEYSVRNFTDTESLNDRVSGCYAIIRITVLNETVCFEE